MTGIAMSTRFAVAGTQPDLIRNLTSTNNSSFSMILGVIAMRP
jgi:hypothetical protein